MNDKYIKLIETLPKESEELWFEYNLEVNKIIQENQKLKESFDKYKKKITPIKMLQRLDMLEQENQQLKEQISAKEEYKKLLNKGENLAMKENIIFNKSSEEYKAIKYLEHKITNYNDNSLIIHYNTILYNLIINLMKENKKQKEINKKAINYIKNRDFAVADRLSDLLQILKDKEIIDYE